MSFDATVAAMDDVVAHARGRASRAGYFAAMYRSVTRQVRDRAQAGEFADPERMERFVGTFAGRYLDAYWARDRGQLLTKSWAMAFDAAEKWSPAIVQHLLVGVNAHINLDLGVVAAELGGDAAGLNALRPDFDLINDVLASLVDPEQGALDRVSPWLSLLDHVGGSDDEAIVNFSLRVARSQAWRCAETLVGLTGAARDDHVQRVDAAVAQLTRRVLHPGVVIGSALLVVRLRETKSVVKVIDVLSAT